MSFMLRSAAAGPVLHGPDGKCRLSQVQLISLVQQVGFALHEDPANKLTWLRETVLSIDQSDSSIAQFIGPVIEEVTKNLTGCARDYPPEQQREARLLNSFCVALVTPE